MQTPPRRLFPWVWIRRAVQLGFLILFLWLFRKTEGTGTNEISHWLTLFFQMDPLVAASAMIAGRVLLWIFIPAAIILVATALLGRFFCGWICALGTLLDGFHSLVRPVAKRIRVRLPFGFQKLRSIRVALVVIILLSAALGLQIVGYFDPFSILTRATTTSLDSFFYHSATDGSGWLYNHAPKWITAVSEPIYAFLKDHFFPIQEPVYVAGGISLSILSLIFALEFFERRFWCRYLCPLGGMLGLVAHYSPFRRTPPRSCSNCRACETDCRMGAFDADHRYSPEACNLCLDCVENCPKEMVSFTIKPHAVLEKPTDLSKRVFLGSLALGVALPMTARAASWNQPSGSTLRPPGVNDEKHFLDICVRCGECIKVCPNHALQTSLLGDGLEAVFSPKLMPRIGYCEYNCNLCGQVCPTGAIPSLPLEKKQAAVIGHAIFDYDRCIRCLVCEEHCPIPDKAIHVAESDMTLRNGTQIKKGDPYVNHKLCIGCGICEYTCPLEGEAAIHVKRGRRKHGNNEKSS